MGPCQLNNITNRSVAADNITLKVLNILSQQGIVNGNTQGNILKFILRNSFRWKYTLITPYLTIVTSL